MGYFTCICIGFILGSLCFCIQKPKSQKIEQKDPYREYKGKSNFWG